MLCLSAKLTDPIAHGAVAETESFGDFGQWLLLDEDGPQGFVTAMPGVGGLKKELRIGVRIHREPPCKMSFLFPWKLERV